MRLCLALAFLLATVTSGCGYHTAGSAARLPDDAKVIAVPAFVNQTKSYRIEQSLTNAVVREMIGRTRMRVVNVEDASEADLVVKGTVVKTNSAPLTYDSATGRVSSALVTVNMSVSVVDRKGRVLFQNPNYVFREQYQVSREVSSFFEEESPALERLSRDFARTFVTDILEGL